MVEKDGIIYADDPAPMLNVIDIRPLAGYRLWLRFNDGAEKIADMSSKLERPAFAPLKDTAIFNSVIIEYGAPSWMNGEIDIAPEWLYDNGNPIGAM